MFPTAGIMTVRKRDKLMNQQLKDSVWAKPTKYLFHSITLAKFKFSVL